MADLEGAEDALAFASGMAAIAAVFLTFLSAGDHVVVSSDAYCDVHTLLTAHLSRFGVSASFADTSDLAAVAAAVTPRTRLIYTEILSNPALKLANLPDLAGVAAAAGARLCVDNTFATPILCRPLTHGADLVLHSATKFLGGHHDLCAGVVAGGTELVSALRRQHDLLGTTVGAFDAQLALTGIATLAARVTWSSESAAAVAVYLQDHPQVAAVRYPALAAHAQAALVRRLLPRGAGAMVTFDLASGPRMAAAVVRNLTHIPYVASLGGVTTTVCFPPRAYGDIVPSATLRLSIGLEDPREVIADLDRALERAVSARSS